MEKPYVSAKETGRNARANIVCLTLLKETSLKVGKSCFIRIDTANNVAILYRNRCGITIKRGDGNDLV